MIVEQLLCQQEEIKKLLENCHLCRLNGQISVDSGGVEGNRIGKTTIPGQNLR